MKKRLLIVGVCLGVSGCASLRKTALDHRLPTPTAPTVDLACYRSVQDRPGQDPDLAMAAAISGGGHRAANFAIGVLLGLEALEVDGRRVDLLKEIDYFSTVSGGGFAAGAYVASLHDHLRKTGGRRDGYSLAASLRADKKRLLGNLERDYQGAIFEEAICLRCLGFCDAGDILERKLDRYVLGSAYRDDKRSLVLGDVFRAAGDGRVPLLPYWVPNATVYENGVRVPFTPDVLAQYHVTGCTHNMRRMDLAGDLFAMPLAVGVKASASFPVAIPATTLRCDPPADKLNRFLHLMDGGLADNMGYRTAIELLRQDPARRKVLLIIDAYKGGPHPHSATQRSPAGLEVVTRVMKISLDADHSHLGTRVTRLAAGESIEVIFLSFDQLRPALTEQIGDLRKELARLRAAKGSAMVRRIRRDLGVALAREEAALQDAEDTFALYHDARAVATSLNITRGEQKLLIEAGRAVAKGAAARLGGTPRPTESSPGPGPGRARRLAEPSAPTQPKQGAEDAGEDTGR